MRKNSIRKFVHAVLDLIPLFIIPIFAIYTRNENYNSHIEVNIQKAVMYESNEVQVAEDLVIGNVYRWTDNYVVDASVINLHLVDITPTDFLTERFNIQTNYNGAQININQQGRVLLQLYNNGAYLISYQIGGEVFDFVLANYNSAQTSVYLSHITNTNVEYVKEYETTTYNDTDVGSQFVYTLYNATDKYFNMNNVFNMNDVYDWFVLNIFGGNAPLGLYIVWNIVLYEFVMDLLMLLYGVFMFFIDCCTKLIEKPLNAIK